MFVIQKASDSFEVPFCVSILTNFEYSLKYLAHMMFYVHKIFFTFFPQMNWMTLVKVTRPIVEAPVKSSFLKRNQKPPSAMPEERPVSKVTFSTMYIRIFRIPIGKVICIITICIFLIIPLVLRTKNIKANEIHQLALHSNKSKWSFHKTHGAKPESFLTFREMLDIAQKQDPRTKAIWGFSDSVTKKDVDILNVVSDQRIVCQPKCSLNKFVFSCLQLQKSGFSTSFFSPFF